MKIILTLTAFVVWSHAAFAQELPRAMDETSIGRVGSTDLRLIAPAHLKQAAYQMSYGVKRYREASEIFREDLRKNPSARFSYLALCQLDTSFRQQEYVFWKGRPVTLPAEMFRQGVVLYMNHQSYVFNGPIPLDAHKTNIHYRGGALMDKVEGPLSVFEALWRKEPNALNGILLAAVKTDIALSRKERDRDFFQQLLEVSVGAEYAEKYKAARASGWCSPVPEVKSLNQATAALLAAVISNDMSNAGTFVPNKADNLGYSGDGKAIARYSFKTGDYTFLEGTEARFPVLLAATHLRYLRFTLSVASPFNPDSTLTLILLLLPFVVIFVVRNGGGGGGGLAGGFHHRGEGGHFV